MILTTRDVVVRTDVETHLTQMADKYGRLLDAAPDAMVVVNQDGEIEKGAQHARCESIS